ncbi:RmlC-like cupin domain-containing protein [Hypoxylon trugodes]|uniref:RmlC-like cupin domain-containing protein n=1 Tax=Hypoxylon trugodes TaxID=326681 RepID=UPI002191DD33|nr:RmlC-like cupin domain-containing protein [Hypoxylon trugodes]KAI1389643.1 RmlC-like cupin domain-containing protein [Hypoxylon trugodes]
MSSIELKPSFTPSSGASESPDTDAVIKALSLIPHIEGGYFVETDARVGSVGDIPIHASFTFNLVLFRDPLLIPSPFPEDPASALMPQRPGFNSAYRNASTSIFYYLTPISPQGNFHRNRGRTVHTLHRGRGVYVLIHADEPDLPGGGKRIETFVVGSNVAKGEKLQWIVEGGKFKASFLLPDDAAGTEKTSGGLLISETVVPGFEYCDHDFLPAGGLPALVGKEKAEELAWLVRKA